MRIETIKIYSFEELSPKAQEKAIQEVTESLYEIIETDWLIDNCALFEPSHEEIREIDPENILKNGFLIENTRKNIYFDCGRNRYVQCAEAMYITNETLFLKWLGIPEEEHENFYFTIDNGLGRNSNTRIEFQPNDLNEDFTDDQINLAEQATERFDEHIKEIINRIESEYDYLTSEEYAKERINDGEYEFNEDGTIY